MAQSSNSYQDWLAAYRERLQHNLASFRGLETRWSWIRLIAFVAGLAAVILLRHNLPLAAGAGIAGALAFAGAVLRHVKWEDRRAFAERALIVAAESLHASTRRDSPARAWQRPEDAAEIAPGLPPVIDSGPHWPLTDQERDDLDLYGPPVGIFGLLNRTSTSPGARRLRDILDSPSLSPEHIRQRQDAVRWLRASTMKQRLGMMATLVLLRGHGRHLDRLIPAAPSNRASPAVDAVRGHPAVVRRQRRDLRLGRAAHRQRALGVDPASVRSAPGQRHPPDPCQTPVPQAGSRRVALDDPEEHAA